MIEIRLHGSREECDAVLARLPEIFDVARRSPRKKDHGSDLIRIYVHGELKPAEGGAR